MSPDNQNLKRLLIGVGASVFVATFSFISALQLALMFSKFIKGLF